MELQERITLCRGMLECKYKACWWEFDKNLELLQSDCENSEIFLKILEADGCLEQIKQHIQDDTSIFYYGSSAGILFGAIYHRVDGECQQVYMQGPVFSTEVNMRDIEDNLQKMLSLVTKETQQGFSGTALQTKIMVHNELKHTPSVLPVNFAIDLVMLNYCINGERLMRSDIVNMQPKHEFRYKNRKKDRHKTWIAESALLRMVREGDLNYKSTLEQAENLSNGVPAAINVPLRQAKISGQTFATLCTRAAIDGGLTPEMSYQIGDMYIQQIEECKRVSDVMVINRAMYEDFIQRVHKSRCNPSVSSQIQSCADYIETHTDEPISIAELAAQKGYTKYYFSRKFKQEMKVSVNDYINITKVERAKTLLSTGTNSIADIVEQLGFCSGSYFANVFQRYVGMGPSEYRQRQAK